MIDLDVVELPGAACCGVTEPLWDDMVHGETAAQRHQRHQQAQAICQSCPARTDCLTGALRLRDRAVEPMHRPTGIWGGERFTAGRCTPPRTCPVCNAAVIGNASKKYCCHRCANVASSRANRRKLPEQNHPGLDPVAVNEACAGRLPAKHLTGDERTEAVCRLTAAGWSIPRIASQLQLTERAVSRNRRKLQEVA